MKVIFMDVRLSKLHELSPSPNRPVYLCRGKDCRKNQDRLCSLEQALSRHGEIVDVQCQKICKGPVAGLEIDGQLEWFRKIGSAKSRQSLIRLLTTGEMKDRLSQRIASKRRGKLRGELPLAAK